MKLFIVLTIVALAQAAKLDRTYLPPNAQESAGSLFLETPRESNGFKQTSAFSNGFSNQNANAQSGAYSSFEARPERAQAAFERNAAILRQDKSNDGETYAYAYETENGIYGEENGVATNGVQAQGGYSYTGDDGKVYSVRYTADENGFQPQGDHLPTPPPVPEEILKALEQNARDEAAGIFDDGSYNEGKYDSNSQQQFYNNAQGNNYNNANFVVTNNGFSRNDAAGIGSSAAGIQKAYLPPFAQRTDQRSAVRQPTFNNNALLRIDAAGSGSSVAGLQKAYLPPFAQRTDQRSAVRQPTFNNNALLRIDAAGSGNSVAGLQKAYLPPFAQRTNQRSAVGQPTFNNNALLRNDAAGSGSPVAGLQKAYLPPFPQRTNQRSAVRQPTFNNNAFLRNDDAGSGSSVAGLQKAYLPPVAQRRQSSFNARNSYQY